MILVAFAALAAVISTGSPAVAAVPPKAAVTARVGSLTDLTADFVAFADATAALPDIERVRAFHAHFDPILAGYYDGKGESQAEFDAQIAERLRGFTEKRAAFISTSASFAAKFALGQKRFKKHFADYRLSVPVYLVHSMGQQDGGTRTVDGRTIMFFGADVIAKIHDDTTIGPFLDHELFHVYHAKYFADCPQLWCSLWQEGMATYVAAQLNPGASDRALLLTQPMPIRAAVEPRLAEAMCGLRAKLGSESDEDYGVFFLNRSTGGSFPGRYGYYLGYLLAAKVGATMPLQALAKLPQDKIKPLLQVAIDSYGPCASPPAVTP